MSSGRCRKSLTYSNQFLRRLITMHLTVLKRTCYQRSCERYIKGRELAGERKRRKKSRGICNTIAHQIMQNVAVYYFSLAHPHHPLLLSYRGNCF